jgi:hypothetical protein
VIITLPLLSRGHAI